jgi:uncharacterized membrane protein
MWYHKAMSTKNTAIVLLALIALAFLAGALVYPSLPAQVASHWNAAGEADGAMGKFWGVFLFPFIMLGVFALFLIIPKIDPMKANIESFRKHYDAFWIGMFVFFLYIFALTLAWNTGHRFNFTTWIIPAVSALFFGLGAFLEKSKRNWFIGIRTPWTLSSDTVWEKTHRLGGKFFKGNAVISLLGIFFGGDMAILFLIVPMAVTVAVTVVYSYLEYRKETRKIER